MKSLKSHDDSFSPVNKSFSSNLGDDFMITPDSSFNIRLNAIKQQHCPREIFINIYGLDLWKDASEVAGRFNTWSANSQNKTIVFNVETVDRWAFESFLQ